MENEDEYELEQDASYKGSRTPTQIMEHELYIVHGGNYKSYLNSIEWDTWLQPYEPGELARVLEEAAIKSHPFNKFF